jgi:hypothetical protein
MIRTLKLDKKYLRSKNGVCVYFMPRTDVVASPLHNHLEFSRNWLSKYLWSHHRA